MPTDMALPLFLSQEDFAFRRSPQDRSPASSCHEHISKKTKKQVTFADHRGLPLTRVKVFSQFKDAIHIPRSVRLMPSNRDDDNDELVLDFTQPASDYVLFRQSLDRKCVCLENCVLKERTLRLLGEPLGRGVRLRQGLVPERVQRHILLQPGPASITGPPPSRGVRRLLPGGRRGVLGQQPRAQLPHPADTGSSQSGPAMPDMRMWDLTTEGGRNLSRRAEVTDMLFAMKNKHG